MRRAGRRFERGRKCGAIGGVRGGERIEVVQELGEIRDAVAVGIAGRAGTPRAADHCAKVDCTMSDASLLVVTPVLVATQV
jgi:hypothetical protein